MDPQKAKEESVLAFALSYLIAVQTQAVWGHCYENSYRAFFAIPETFSPHGVFVEGFVVFADPGTNKIVLIEHSWLISSEAIFRTGDSRHRAIIDPTLVLILEPGQAVYYFPGVLRNEEGLLQLENEFFPHVRFEEYGEDGMGHPEYKAAYLAAKQQAETLLTPLHTFVEVRAAELSAHQEQDEQLTGTEGILIIMKREE